MWHLLPWCPWERISFLWRWLNHQSFLLLRHDSLFPRLMSYIDKPRWEWCRVFVNSLLKPEQGKLRLHFPIWLWVNSGFPVLICEAQESADPAGSFFPPIAYLCRLQRQSICKTLLMAKCLVLKDNYGKLASKFLSGKGAEIWLCD